MKFLKAHNKKCQIVDTKNEHYIFIEESYYWGNGSGNVNKKRSNFNTWLKLRCNDPDCDAIVAINDFDATREILRQKYKKM